MHTAAIAHRVADFLKQHPPFEFMEEAELVALAARGRVKFHEPDEYICWQASPHAPMFYVIQQGAVALWDESAEPAALRDMLGAGDSIGMERFNGSPVSLYSAKTTSEVVVYALPAAELEPLLASHPRAAEYVSAHAAVTAGYAASSDRPRPYQQPVAGLAVEFIACPAQATICEAARRLAETGAPALAVSGAAPAILTTGDLLKWVADGAVNPNRPARELAEASAAKALPPEATVSEAVLALAASRGAWIRAGSGIVTAATLAPAFGDHPLAILAEISAAPSLAALCVLNARARAWLLAQLTEPPALDWLAAWAAAANRRLLERLLAITGEDRRSALYCFYGAAGREELLTGVAPQVAIVGGTAPPCLAAWLAECGYSDPAQPDAAPLAEWQARFSGWIHDPVRNAVASSRALFDLRSVCGPARLFDDLETHVRAELAAEPSFLRLLAHDCLASLPPLIFFRDLVIEDYGARGDVFRLESSALQPLADVARVLGIFSGKALGASTRERFGRAARLLPGHETVLAEATETMRVVLFHQARAGLRQGSGGERLPLSQLSRQDRRVLKSGFRSIHNLLQFTASCDWMEEVEAR